MKTLFTFLLILTLLFPSFGVSDYKSNDDLYVWAISGLNLRTQPDAKSSKIINIPYGEKVKIIDTQINQHHFSYMMSQSNKYGNSVAWEIDGYWVQVKYGNEEGYVFDGYLGKFPTITTSAEEIPYLTLETFKAYGKEHWGGLKNEKKETMLDFDDNARDPDKGRSSSYFLTFKNGSSYKNVEESFSGYVSIFIKDISLEEGYLFLNASIGLEYKQKVNKENGSLGDGTYLSSIKKDQVNFTGNGMNIMIKKVEGGVIIQSGGGC
ncbi:MAG: SH3 domain-containing protein [Saprospiraceae bacterium]